MLWSWTGKAVHNFLTIVTYSKLTKFKIRIGLLVYVCYTLLSFVGGIHPIDAAATLRHSDPRPDSTQDRSPMEVLTWFSVPITAGSDLRIFDADFTDMANGKPEIDPNDVTLLRLPVISLPAGRYTVKWRAEGRDGSITEGEFKFNVAPALNYSEVLPLLLGIGTVLITLLGSGIGWWLLRRWIRLGRR